MSNSLNIFDTKSSNFIRHNGFSRVQTKQAPIHPHAVWFQFTTVSAGCSNISKTLFTVFPAIMQYLSSAVFAATGTQLQFTIGYSTIYHSTLMCIYHFILLIFKTGRRRL